MRFLEDGPSIPPQLIEQQALGNVIFLCGAGVSRQAGLPDFTGLTIKIVHKLSAERAQKALDAEEGFDRVFNVLIEDFGAQEIDRQIYKALKTPRKPKVDHHRIILNLSRGPEGLPQILTTNFDLLFEKVHRNIRRFVPPSLPEISLGDTIQGIVYLHGRLANPEGRAKAGYIISSADFGRAYLAEGWAARFVRAIRERYTIVLLGYSANDPPMRYLLEGLHSRERVKYGSPIYAFAAGSDTEVEEEWRDRGVTAIGYDALDTDHTGLWATLSAWATASSSTESWNAKTVALAQKHPSELKPYERGQVAFFVSKKSGAKLFADASPSPPAEWLCVLDANVRYATPTQRLFDEATQENDPLVLFGLDDDPPRLAPDLNGPGLVIGKDYLTWMVGEAAFPERTRLALRNPSWSNQLPDRLYFLSSWIARISHEPAAVWWVAGYRFLNPSLIRLLKRRLEEKDEFPYMARKFWELYIESSEVLKAEEHEFRWFEFKKLLTSSGWSAYAFREFERAIDPHVIFARHLSVPPSRTAGNWGQLALQSVVNMEVGGLDRHDTEVAISDEHLPKAIEIIRQSLLRIAELLNAVETQWWRPPTLHPEGNRVPVSTATEKLFFWFVELFKKLMIVDPAAARVETSRWFVEDRFFFGKLWIFVQMEQNLRSSKEAAAALVKLSDVVFWDAHNQRELLFTIRARWSQFNMRERRRLERRIIAGAPRVPQMKTKEYLQRKKLAAASILRWLQLSGCEITISANNLLPRLKSAHPLWNDEWARTADESRGIKGGWITTVTELRGLDELPVDQIVIAAENRTEDKFGELKHFRPFEGLVKTYPFKALCALRYEARHFRYPARFWQNLLSDWPDSTPPRLMWLMARTLAMLPETMAFELRYYLPNWLGKHLRQLAEENHVEALVIFDAVLARYKAAEPNATKSSIGTTTVGGKPTDKSELSLTKAINSPCGILTECLLSLHRTASPSQPIPVFLSERLDILFAVPGNGGGHAACIAASRLGWLDYHYHSWVKRKLIPFFSLENPQSEAVWHGLAGDNNWPLPKTLRAINKDFLEMLVGHSHWKLDESGYRYHVQRFVFLTRKNGNQQPIISFTQAHTVLKALQKSKKMDVLGVLSQLITNKGEWKKFIKPFIENAWPRQLRHRSLDISSAFVRLLCQAGSDFPEAVNSLSFFLTPVPDLNMILYLLTDESEAIKKLSLARSFPEASLSLLDTVVPPELTSIASDLPRVLEIIADSAPVLRQNRAWRRLRDTSG